MAHAVAILLLLSYVSGVAHQQRQPNAHPPSTPASARPAASAGEQLFNSSCAACHNLDGRGGGHAPNIAAGSAPQSYSDEQIRGIIRNGIPNRGMPAFASLSEEQIASVVRYLRVLQRTDAPASAAATGNPQAGRALFFGKAQCARCHMAKGSGGFLASDLTGVSLSSEAIVEAIVHPKATAAGVLTAATLRDGSKISGLLRNEDNFSIQLQGERGEFYLLLKSQIAALQRSTQPYMPSDYSQRLSPSELRDLVSFVSAIASPDSPRPHAR